MTKNNKSYRSLMVDRPRTLQQFKAKYPTLFRKLVYWASKRYGEQSNAVEQVNTYLHELVLSRSNDFAEAKPYLKIWNIKLSAREREELWKVVPYRFPPGEFLNYKDAQLESRWYDAGYSVLTEKLTNELYYKSSLQGILSINSYEATILNAERMLIVDVDIDGDYLEYNTAPVSEKQAITALYAWQAERGGNFRVYRTAGGLRYIETSREWLPSSLETKRVMSNLYADIKYSLLCQTQETFRARLTPKPWRYDDWKVYSEDEEETKDVAVCKLMIVVGEQTVDDRFKNLITLHDKKTKAFSKGLDLV
jgi:hypothetical protein